ncbi:MAG TPA: ABC transporter ATP-binding protein [Trueperaceae bacterium]|nr:ABC transporter ATP-binding protein [Trueperaceae bacterium]
MTDSRVDTKYRPEGAVVLDGVHKTYDRGAVPVHALRGVSLSLPAGELVVVLGPSGSGKTTLLNVIGGIDSPTDGSVRVDGEDIGRYDEHRLTEYRRRTVGFVFQFFNLVPTLTALENVALIAELTGGAGNARRMLEQVGMEDRLDHFPAALSGGEQQRVAVARALSKRPRLLLCDEPTGALDLETGRSVLGLLRQLNRDEGLTTILVTHNSAIAAMADRVVRMRSGELVSSEPVQAPVDADEVNW